MAENPFHKSVTGVIYPTDYVTAVVDDLADASQAIQALQQAGFSEQDIVLVVNKQVLAFIQEQEQHRTLFNRVMAAVADIVSDEGEYYQLYKQEALLGHHILNVYAPHTEIVDRAYEVLKAHHAHSMKFFGRWSIADLK